ncbi:DUF4131 domain-containing protein, partial [Microbacterium sp.]|uniref:DUF4131 domain-containing protein n=1 Tax=Microbacterium sp. TaxID=51671 RepID=UPI00333E44AF
MSDPRGALLAGGIWAAALTAVMLPDAVPWLMLGLLTLAGAAALFGRPRRSVGMAVVVLLGCASAAAAVWAGLPARQQAADLGGRAVEVVAEVVSSPSVGRDGRLWFDAQTSRLGSPGRTEALSAPVRIGIAPRAGIDPGAVLRVTGQAEEADAGERPALVVFGADADVVSAASGVFGVAAEVRTAFIARADRLPEPGAGLLPGLAVGDTRAVSGALDAAMKASGLSHLTAVSG